MIDVDRELSEYARQWRAAQRAVPTDLADPTRHGSARIRRTLVAVGVAALLVVAITFLATQLDGSSPTINTPAGPVDTPAPTADTAETPFATPPRTFADHVGMCVVSFEHGVASTPAGPNGEVPNLPPAGRMRIYDSAISAPIEMAIQDFCQQQVDALRAANPSWNPADPATQPSGGVIEVRNGRVTVTRP